MPQMAPMNWLMLFFTMTLIFIILMSMNYYLYTPSIKKTEVNKENKINHLIWKW